MADIKEGIDISSFSRPHQAKLSSKSRLFHTPGSLEYKASISWQRYPTWYCNLDTENEIAVRKENAGRRTDAGRDAEGNREGKG